MNKPEIIVKYSERSVFPDIENSVLGFDTREENVFLLGENIFKCLTHASKKQIPEISLIFYSGVEDPENAVGKIADGIHNFIAKNPHTSIKTIVLAPDDRDMETRLRERVQYH